MSDKDSSENKDTGERRITPRIPPLELFRQAWEELRRERNENFNAQNVQIVTKDGQKKKVSCLEFWKHMFKEVEERKKLPDYIFTPLAEQKIWETFTVTLEDPTEDESAISMRGLHYIPRPSNTYLQNLNLGYDQWYIAQDFPPKPKVIKILRRRPKSPSDNDDEMLEHLIQAMDWACPTPSESEESSSSTAVALPTTILEDEDRIASAQNAAREILKVIQNSSRNTVIQENLNVTPSTSSDIVTRAILNVSPEPVEDEIGFTYDSQKIEPVISIDEASVLHEDTSISNDVNTSQEENINSIPSAESPQPQSVPLPQSEKPNQDWQHQGDRRQESQQQSNQSGRGRKFRLQRTYRQPSSSRQRLPLPPAPAHLRLQSFNPNTAYPAHQALPHYDSAWNYSNSFAPYEIVPWNSNQLPFVPQTPVPPMYMQMPYVQLPAPHWVPSENTNVQPLVYPTVMTPNPWIPQQETLSVNTNIAQQQYYPAENYQVAHKQTYNPESGTPQYFLPYRYINNRMAHQSTIISQNKYKNTAPYTVVRPEQIAAHQLEMNCKIIEKTAPESVKPLSENQSIQNNAQSGGNIQTQTTQPLKDSEIFKVPPPPKTTQSAIYYHSQKPQAGQKRKAVQSPTTVPQKDKTIKSNEDKENKKPVDEREYLRAPSIFDILEARKTADPNEPEKAPTNYMEDVIQRKERRWKLMDKVPGCPRLDIVLEMIKKDNEMLEEEERLQREKEKSQTVAGSSTEMIEPKVKHENPSQVKSEIPHAAPVKIVGKTDKEKRKREQEQTLKNLYSVQYFNTENEPEPIDIECLEPPVIIIGEQEKPNPVSTLSSEEIIQHTPSTQTTEPIQSTAASIHAADRIEVEIDDEERMLLENLVTSTERFNPDIWVSDEVVLQLMDEDIFEQKKPRRAPQRKTARSAMRAKGKQRATKIKVAKRPLLSPILERPTNNDQPKRKRKKKFISKSGAEKSKPEQPVTYCARDQATQTSDIQEEDDTTVPVETKEQTSQTDIVWPKILTYAAIVRKNKN